MVAPFEIYNRYELRPYFTYIIEGAHQADRKNMLFRICPIVNIIKICDLLFSNIIRILKVTMFFSSLKIIKSLRLHKARNLDLDWLKCTPICSTLSPTRFICYAILLKVRIGLRKKFTIRRIVKLMLILIKLTRLRSTCINLNDLLPSSYFFWMPVWHKYNKYNERRKHKLYLKNNKYANSFCLNDY